MRKPVSLLQYGLRKTSSLKPDPKNARQHSETQLDQIAASIKKFGFTAPIIATAKGLIVAGEGRWRGAMPAALLVLPPA